MDAKRNLVGWTCRSLIAVVICLTAIGVWAIAPLSEKAPQPRVDIINIDGLKAFGDLERPSVIYLHQKHTVALASKNKDCAACHLSEKDRMSFKYMRLKDTDKQTVMNIYHDNCIACHTEMRAAKEKTGPVVCAECHVEKAVASAWQPIDMDKSLHYRHVKARDSKCEQCHHEYDETAKKLVYVKDKEGSCRYCHGETKVENRISYRSAAHSDCVNCHQAQVAMNKDAGPISCAGCHAAEQQQLIEVVKDVPRLKRNQPDLTLVKPIADDKDVKPLNRLNAVPFNHKAHEAANESCRVCHHADLNACVSCHTPAGSEKGNYVNLQDSMHRAEAQMSCLGCHTSKQMTEPACAGCHKAIPPQQAQDQNSCLSCHSEVPAGIDMQMDEKRVAEMLLEARRPKATAYKPDDIPDVVEINALSNKYGGVKLPHRKIVNKLVSGMGDSQLAAYFHRDSTTICQGCHHNSPAGLKPPKCASCHGKPFDSRDPYKPGLQAAYHIQCINCHSEMGIEQPVSTNCTGCHRAKP